MAFKTYPWNQAMKHYIDGLPYSASDSLQWSTCSHFITSLNSQRARLYSGQAWPILAFQTSFKLDCHSFFCRGIYGERYRPVDFFLRKWKMEWLWDLKINLGSTAEHILKSNSNQRQDVMNGDWLRPSHSLYCTAFDWLKCTQEHCCIIKYVK